jgi:integrase
MPRPRKPGSIYDRFERHADRTFGEAAARYLAEYQGKDKSRAAQSIDAVAPYIGHMRLIDVDDEAMQQFKEDRRLGRTPFVDKNGKAMPAMAGTINKDLTQVVTVLNKACRVWRWLPSTPKLEHVKGAARQAYPFTWEEQDRLFSALPTGWDCGAALFLVNTGVRKQEMFGLKWSDRRWMPELDIKNHDGTVKERMYVFILADTKNGEQRAVICNSIARRAVEYQRKVQAKHGQSEYVFPTRRGSSRGKVRDAGVVWDRAWKAAGLPVGKFVKRGMHNCRHTFAHRLRAAEVPQEDRNALLGHANTNLAEHYAQSDVERLLAYAERVTIRRETTILRVVG